MVGGSRVLSHETIPFCILDTRGNHIRDCRMNLPRGIGSLCLATFLLSSCPGCSHPDSAVQKRADVIRNVCIYESPSEYCAWPSVTRTSGGNLIVLFTKSEEHLGPNGAIMLSRSTDNGKTWLPPVVVLDSPIDDRESGITSLRDGRILAHFWSTFHTKDSYERLPQNAYRRDVLDRWITTVEQPEYQTAETSEGAWLTLSSDGGRTWSDLIRGYDSVHGGIELSTGGLLLASYRTSRDSIVIHEADSAAGPWRFVASLASPQPDSIRFGEPHLLQLPSGRVIMMIRATAHPYNDQDPRCVLWESYSDDKGKTWVEPFATLLWGFPPHLVLLSDGRILCTYGYRRPPFGQRACLSNDGVHWDLRDELVLRDDAPNGDLGYPASIELEPGVILTVYYQPDVPRGTIQNMDPPDPNRTKPGILGTIWRVPPRK
jgi:sialidase-1